MTFTLHNAGGRSLFLEGCPSVPSGSAELLVGDRWQQHFQFGTICLAIFSPEAVTLHPGESIHDTLSWQIPAGLPLPAQYRFRFYFGLSPEHRFAYSAQSVPIPVR